MRAIEFIIESNNIASAEQVWDYVDGVHPKDQQGGGFLKSLVMRNPQYELKRVPLSSLHVPNDEDEGNDPYGRAMFVDADHAREYSQHHIDKKPLVIDSQGHILDGAHRAWAASELLNKTDIMAWVPVKQSVAEDLNEAVSDNYLYHATMPAGMMRILRTGIIKATDRPQPSTKSKTQYPTISTTRSKQYAESNDFVDFLNLPNDGNAVILVFDRAAVANHYKMFSTSQGTQTVGDEYEEVIVAPKGSMPIKGTLKGFYFNPNRTEEIEGYQDVPWFNELLTSPYYMGQKQGVAEGKLIESAVFLNPTTVIVGQAHGQPLELSPNTLKQIQAIAAKHGAYYEGNGTDRAYTKGQIDRYVGSWDDEVAKTANPNDPKWLYVLFANVDANNRVQRVGVDPKDTIFNRLLATAKDNSFQSIGYTSQALQKFLQMSSEGKYDFVKMSQQPATQENLTRFLKAGEALMWPNNWEQYPNKAGKIAKAATVDVRDQYLATRKAGVYVTGSGHLKAVQNITGKQGVAEGFSNDMSTEDMIAYLRQHHDTNLHQDYLNHLNTFSKFVLKDVPTNTLKTDLPGLDREKVERYKKMDQSKAPPIVLGGKYILDGYHRANAVKEMGIPTIKAYVGISAK